MTTIHWGLLSTARINRRLIPAIRQCDNSTVHAVGSRNLDRSKQYAGEWNIPVAYGSYDEVLADPTVDVVYNSLPNDMHADWTVRSLEAGKHVLCEKPMCLSLAELQRIEDAAAANNRTAMEAFMYLHHPHLDVIRELIHDGPIGELKALRSAFTFYFNRPEDNYRMSAEQGGGSLWDVGVYPLSLFQTLVGSEPLSASGMALGEPVDTRFLGNLIYENGVTGQFTSGFDADYSNYTVIHCTKGFLTLSHPFTNTDECKAYLYQGDSVEEVKLPKRPLYKMQVENMNAIALGQAEPNVTLSQTRGHLRTVLSLIESAQRQGIQIQPNQAT